MAVLAPKDWHPPREHGDMDAQAAGSSPSSLPRSRSSPAPDGGTPAGPPPNGAPAGPFPFAGPPPGASQWTPSPNAQPFYPQYFQNPAGPGAPGTPTGPPPFIHPAQMQGQMPPGPYFDPNANAQFAQWAYHQMMLNAQQQAAVQMQQQYPQQMNPMQMHPYQAGTPPGQPGYGMPNNARGGGPHGDYNGFHPYRRPNRSASQSAESSQPSTPIGGPGRTASPNPVGFPMAAGSPQTFQQPPYGSPSGSGSAPAAAPRPRTDSTRSSNSQPGATRRSPAPPSPAPTPPVPKQAPPPAAAAAPPKPHATVAAPPKPHARTGSTTSTATSSSSKPAPVPAVAAPVPRPVKPSPLSQGEMSKTEKRMSRDDSDIAALKDPSAAGRSSGLKGRLRRAFTALQEEEEPSRAPTPAVPAAMSRSTSTPANLAADSDAGSTTAGQKTKKRALFNSRFNRSTDNISISSVSSSASVMIRKLGSFGKLARRNSIAGITSLFKDKKDKDGEEEEGDAKKDKKDKKDKKKGKADVAEAKVSHATAELEGGDLSGDLSGLTPAARLARQHTLKSNAEAAARAKAQQEATAAATAAAERERAAQDANGVPAWDRNTATRSQAESLRRVGEDGRPADFDDDGSDEGSEDGTYRGDHGEYGADAWDEDPSWAEPDNEEADLTIRQGLADAHIEDNGFGEEESEPWAIGLRRSMERSAVPIKGILKNAVNYDQHAYLERTNAALTNRARSNSYGGMPAMQADPNPGPLARIPSPDPDHIDGLHRHGSHSSGGHEKVHTSGDSPAFLPAFAFEGGPRSAESPASNKDTPLPSEHTFAGPPSPEKTLYSLPNSSAPALTAFNGPPPLAQRAVTAPPKKLSFATNLSIYDTFPATVYDRRSEPATSSRLTPALAQRIKEELNSFKMEEMEVHAASRIHTQFFV